MNLRGEFFSRATQRCGCVFLLVAATYLLEGSYAEFCRNIYF
jgi:hypothetical protein